MNAEDEQRLHHARASGSASRAWRSPSAACSLRDQAAVRRPCSVGRRRSETPPTGTGASCRTAIGMNITTTSGKVRVIASSGRRRIRPHLPPEHTAPSAAPERRRKVEAGHVAHQVGAQHVRRARREQRRRPARSAAEDRRDDQQRASARPARPSGAVSDSGQRARAVVGVPCVMPCFPVIVRVPVAMRSGLHS